MIYATDPNNFAEDGSGRNGTFTKHLLNHIDQSDVDVQIMLRDVRMGVKTAYWWGNQASHEYANYGTDSCCNGLAQGRDRWVNTSPVGSFDANPWGVYDTAGNVWEWVCSAYASSYDGNEQRCQTTGDADRVFRGGSWGSVPSGVLAAYRNYYSPGFRSNYVGFRLARSSF